jgi:hypothetical protein
MKKGVTFFVVLVVTITLHAHDFEVDGICYNYLEGNNVEVTYKGYYSAVNEYSGTVIIPETITYNGTTYSVTTIGTSAFGNCFSLTSITIGNSVTTIKYGAFFRCSSLASITIPNSVTSIGGRAFYECTSLTSFTIGNSVISIEECAFERCFALTSVTIPNSVTSIGDGAFFDCYSLTSITIPSNVTSIGKYIFGTSIENGISDPFLTTISVEDSNPIYDSRENCNAIIETATNTLIAGCHNTIIPNSVTSIGDYAFYGCFGLSSIMLPNSVTSIEDYAFAGCFNLSSITIPNSITSIGEGAFSGGPPVITIICEAIKVPALESYVFYDRDLTEATLYVPAQSLDDYKAAEQWKEFGKILSLEEAPNAVDNISALITYTKKLFRNGQVYILQDSKTYTITGAEIK